MRTFDMVLQVGSSEEVFVTARMFALKDSFVGVRSEMFREPCRAIEGLFASFVSAVDCLELRWISPRRRGRSQWCLSLGWGQRVPKVAF